MAKEMEYGLPQGSIIGPRAFTIYTIPIARIIKKHNLSYHFYADDIQIYASFDPSDPSSIQAALSSISACIKEIQSWMTANFLKLNEDKTEFFVALSSHFKRKMPKVSLKIGNDTIHPSTTVRNLGVIFDDVMSMSPHITALSKRITFQLRNITRIRRFLDFNTCNRIIRSLVLSRLDNGNALLMGTNATDIMKLQRLQNWGAKIIFRAGKFDHVSQFLRKLHWLPVTERIQYKILMYVFKCLHELGPKYFKSAISLYEPTRAGLRSSLDTTRLTVPNFNSKGLESAYKKSFSLEAPSLWNALPSDIRCSASLSAFKTALKTHLFPQ